jgi:hypothetical protein
LNAGPDEDRPGYHPILWGTLGAVVGAALGFLFAGLVAIPVLDSLFLNDGGLENLGPGVLLGSAALMVGTGGGAVTGAVLLRRWHRGRA